MNRRLSPLLGLVLAGFVVTACGPAVGGLGTLSPGASGSPSAEPSLPQASGDVPPSSPVPTSGPVTTPPTSGDPGNPTAPPTSPAPPTSDPAETMIVRAYLWLAGDQWTGGLVPVLREVPKTQAPARAALDELFRGPTGREVMDGSGIDTAVPPDTRLLGLSIEGGTATVDLSREFEASAGSAASFVNLAQVVYTLTQFPTVERVQFRIEGEDVNVFGSEGIVLDGPQTRADFEDQLPSVFVDGPAWGAALPNPGRVYGNANVFEAQFNLVIRDENGREILNESVMATCGTGCRGTFDVTVAYDVDHPQWGELETHVLSAQDGSVTMIRAYPVWLTPAR